MLFELHTLDVVDLVLGERGQPGLGEAFGFALVSNDLLHEWWIVALHQHNQVIEFAWQSKFDFRCS